MCGVKNLIRTFIEMLNETFQKQPPGGVLKKRWSEICSKFKGEDSLQRVIPKKLLCNFLEIALWHGCSPLNLLHIFRTAFLRTPLDNCFCFFKSTFTWDPKWTQTGLKSQTALKSRSVYMAIYIEISLRHLSKQ